MAFFWSDGAPNEYGLPTQLVVDARDEFRRWAKLIVAMVALDPLVLSKSSFRDTRTKGRT